MRDRGKVFPSAIRAHAGNDASVFAAARGHPAAREANGRLFVSDLQQRRGCGSRETLERVLYLLKG